MKKRFISTVLCLLFLFTCTGCLDTSSKDPDVIEKEPTIVELQNNITSIVDEVSPMCIGVRTTLAEGYSTGSGVVYKKQDGYYYAITNHHVIENGTSFKVCAGGAKYYSSEVVGYDSKNDIAVLRFSTDIIGKNVEIGICDISENEDIVKKGQTAIAIGCPLGLENFNTVTTGIVSNVFSTNVMTDAALNPGNSGGGLFNLSGRLIGINVSKQTKTETENDYISVEGMGYAISMDIVRNSVAAIEKVSGPVERPLLGITVSTINRYTSDSKSVELLPDDVEQAVIVLSVEPNSNASRAGLKVNDVLSTVNNIKISKTDDISGILNKLLKNDEVVIQLLRKETTSFTTKSITVTLK